MKITIFLYVIFVASAANGVTKGEITIDAIMRNATGNFSYFTQQSRSIRRNIDQVAEAFNEKTRQKMADVYSRVYENDNRNGVDDAIADCLNELDQRLMNVRDIAANNISTCTATQANWVVQYTGEIGAEIDRISRGFENLNRTFNDCQNGNFWHPDKIAECKKSLVDQALRYKDRGAKIVDRNVPLLQYWMEYIESIVSPCGELYNHRSFAAVVTPFVNDANKCITKAVCN